MDRAGRVTRSSEDGCGIPRGPIHVGGRGGCLQEVAAAKEAEEALCICTVSGYRLLRGRSLAILSVSSVTRREGYRETAWILVLKSHSTTTPDPILAVCPRPPNRVGNPAGG